MDTPVKNGSSEFNYYEWNRTGRKDAAKHIKSDTRKQPKPEEPIELDPQIRLRPAGRRDRAVLGRAAALDGAQHLGHRALQHRLPDGQPRATSSTAAARRTSTRSHEGTSLRDFVRASDREPLPDELIERYDDAEAREGELVFQPAGA